jgi:hypothetical protein
MLKTHHLAAEAFMIRLQLIMVCGVLFAAGLTWQLASDAQLKPANQAKASTEAFPHNTLTNRHNG